MTGPYLQLHSLVTSSHISDRGYVRKFNSGAWKKFRFRSWAEKWKVVHRQRTFGVYAAFPRLKRDAVRQTEALGTLQIRMIRFTTTPIGIQVLKLTKM